MVQHLNRVGGFDAKNVCFYVSCLDFPRAFGSNFEYSVAVGHSLGRRFGIRAVVGDAALGSASGEGDSGTIAWHWSARTLGAQLTYDLPPLQSGKDVAFGASFGAGPVIALVRSGRGATHAYPADSTTQVTRVGIDLRAAGTIWPLTQRRFFVGLEFGYQFLPGRTEGPYTLDMGSGVLPSYDVQYHHGLVSLVTGVCFP